MTIAYPNHLDKTHRLKFSMKYLAPHHLTRQAAKLVVYFFTFNLYK